ncbi:hypothetical protein BV898_10829 [Hypsibius exemplaris]|uniref:Uncharacterized protein n=1 Tax=Hypsibius exemplaris TaxID=2072580 RepID=A0A1W0WI90_HYPEX|nr:hypothetical protein BV898_10829 [Hypsibius exemplaris]
MFLRKLLYLLSGLPTIFATLRYDGMYLPYGSGDTIVSLFHAHGGSRSHGRKWMAECLDGEAMTGIQDGVDDFERLTFMSCRFMFPHKPASQGVYPFYPRCHVRDFKTQFFCFDAQNASATLNTFMTGLWDSDFNFFVHRSLLPSVDPFTGDSLQPYKCCQTPNGYYIDYVSCYYRSTHDVFFEYFDSTFHILVQCGTGFVMTGISKKQNPYTKEVHVDWIQCCRVGYGPPAAQSPPVYNGQLGLSITAGNTQPVTVPSAYTSQYRKFDEEEDSSACSSHSNNTDSRSAFTGCRATGWDFRYKKRPIPKPNLSNTRSQPLLGGFHPGKIASR